MRLFTISILLFFSSALFAQNFDWTSQTSGVTVNLKDVHFANSQMGWAVGDAGTIINTTDGGQTWSAQTSGVSEILRAVFFIDVNTGWAVGGNLSKALLKTTNGGSTWQSIAASNIMSNLMYDIAFADANTGWLVAYDSVFRTTDGGATWVNEAYTTAVFSQVTRAIAVTSDTTAYMGGSSKQSSTTRAADVFYRRAEQTPILWDRSGFDPNVTGEEIMSIDFINADIGFAGGKNGKLYKKSNYHLSGIWYLNKDVSSNANLISAVSFPSESNGMFCAVVSAVPSYTVIYHTVDTGDTWSATPDTIHDFSFPVLYAPSNDTAWIVGTGGKIYRGVRSTVSYTNISLDLDIRLYPNPTTNLVNVEIKSDKNDFINYTLSDLTGRIIKKGQWNINSSFAKFTLNISDISNGVYLLNLNTDSSQSSFRVIKK